jgi:hypothetical protein
MGENDEPAGIYHAWALREATERGPFWRQLQAAEARAVRAEHERDQLREIQRRWEATPYHKLEARAERAEAKLESAEAKFQRCLDSENRAQQKIAELRTALENAVRERDEAKFLVQAAIDALVAVDRALKEKGESAAGQGS